MRATASCWRRRIRSPRAAGDQLQIWADRAQVPIVRHAEGADPAAVVFDGVQKAKASEADLLIVDTAGRLHNKKNLMEELRKISRVITREYEGAGGAHAAGDRRDDRPERLQQAREFSGEVADASGIVLTKLDGTAKGRHRCCDHGRTEAAGALHRRGRGHRGFAGV